MKIAVLALQGAFIEHETVLRGLGAECFEIRQRRDLEQRFDGLILPGGESTAMGKQLRELNLFAPLRAVIDNKTPVLATCAGLILLAEQLQDESTAHLRTLPVIVKRNGYGRQLGSFQVTGEVPGIGRIPMTFIRAPYIVETAPEVEILAEIDGRIAAVRYENQLAMAFHPELTEDTSIHRYFMKMVQEHMNLTH